MAPLPWPRIWRSSCFMQAHTPRRLIALTRSKTSAGSSAASLGGIWMPALLNAMSSRPKVSTAAVDRGGDLVLVGRRRTRRRAPGARRASSSSVAAVQRCLVDVGQDDGGAGLGERARGGQAHAGAGAGDQGDLAGEVVGRVHAVSCAVGRRAWLLSVRCHGRSRTLMARRLSMAR